MFVILLTLRLQLEFRIGDRTHFGQVQAFQFGFRGNALTDEPIHQEIEYKTEREYKAHEGRNSYELCHQLAAIVTVEEPCDGAVDTVPRAAIVALAVREQPNGNYAPDAASAVHGNCANRVVNFHDAVNILNGETDQHACDQADDHGTDGVNEARRSSDCHKAGQESVAGHRGIGL